MLSMLFDPRTVKVWLKLREKFRCLSLNWTGCLEKLSVAMVTSSLPLCPE